MNKNGFCRLIKNHGYGFCYHTPFSAYCFFLYSTAAIWQSTFRQQVRENKAVTELQKRSIPKPDLYAGTYRRRQLYRCNENLLFWQEQKEQAKSSPAVKKNRPAPFECK